MGTIVVMTEFGKKFLHDVMYVPGLAHNLISIGQLMKKGYYVVFDDDKCLLYDKESMQLIYSVKMAEDKMFPLVFSKVPINAFTSSSDDSLLWHQRFGHLNFRGLTLLSKRNMVNGLPTIRGERQTCEACIFGKHHREKFPKGSSWRA